MIKPKLDTGAKIALLVPITISAFPSEILRYSSYNSASVNDEVLTQFQVQE